MIPFTWSRWVAIPVVAGLFLASPSPTTAIDPEAAKQLESLNRAFTQIAREVTPTVVTITTRKRVEVGSRRIPRSPHDFFFDDGARDDEPRESEGLGSGIVMSSDGYILTNNHVAGGADEITVELDDKQEFPARLVGTDSLTDVAVVKIDAGGLQTARIGDSDRIEIGEWVLAIGAPMGFRTTVTSGIISAIGRNLKLIDEVLGIENFIQTDAPINVGNSGGSLVNLRGEVIGINTAIATPGRTFVGYGFAIPINLAKKVMDDIIAFGRVRRGYLGIGLMDVDAAVAEAFGIGKPRGVLVNEVLPDTPAEAAGLRAEDIILAIDDQEVNRPNQVQSLIARKHPGDQVRLLLLRNRKTVALSAQLGEPDAGPAERQAAGRDPASEDAIEGLGLKVKDLTPDVMESYGVEHDVKGVIVTEVSRVAAREGFLPGDIIYKIRQRDFEQQVETVEDFESAVSRLEKSTNAAFSVYTGGSRLYRTMRIPE